MSKTLALILAIILIIVLVIVFVAGFVIERRTPVPKGCEHLKIGGEECGACNNTNCEFHKEKEGK